MTDQPFSVHVDPDELARQEMAAAAQPVADKKQAKDAAVHHGARDEREAARQQSERTRSGRASRAGGGRSYAFRRS